MTGVVENDGLATRFLDCQCNQFVMRLTIPNIVLNNEIRRLKMTVIFH